MDPLLTDRRYQLLEARLGAGTTPENAHTSHSQQEPNSGSAGGSVPTRIDQQFSSPKEKEEVIATDSRNSVGGSNSGSRMSVKREDKENNKRPLDFDNGDSLGSPEGKSPKTKKTEEIDSGSRGPHGVKNTIKSYFVKSHGTGPGTGAGTGTVGTGVGTGVGEGGAFQHMGTAKTSPTTLVSATSISTTTNTTANTSVSGGAASAKASHERSLNLIDLKKQLEGARMGRELAEAKVQRLEEEVHLYQEECKSAADRTGRLVRSLEEVHRKMAVQDFRRRRDRLALDCVRLGKIVPFRNGPTTISDVWEEGYSLKELSKRQVKLLERKEELEGRKKRVQNQRRAAKRSNEAGGEEEREETINNDLDLDLTTESEVIKTHFEQLRRDEGSLAEERRMLESEKAVHQKELKRCQCEERSRFYRDLPQLNDRYLLTSMLGRGGFSEVWKALDLLELKEVAVKIHQLNPSWSEERKQSYIKHVTREYTIHRDMRHPRVVQLFDVFEIDVNCFATVLEYCRGIDLDEKLKRQKTIPEKDAKAILMQIVSGLRYLNRPLGYGTPEEGAGGGGEGGIGAMGGGMSGGMGGGGMNGGMGMGSKKRLSIIHFDLKPANILFDESGDVKITDFGLSKIIDESNEGTSMELTSQGAGTYWYLPPECFAKGSEAPRISSKVDVWSAGIIFFQMLYGYRPYGEGKTQENVWSEGLIYRASQVEFPTDPKAPKVSEEAKELIRHCLTRDQKFRPDVVALCRHAYMHK